MVSSTPTRAWEVRGLSRMLTWTGDAAEHGERGRRRDYHR
eukprot:CAMPEP_0202071564 /NCGR_PEP_ID=MMETSP0964-20121228/1870_1 /ASSEMBLY_ACC=CAM_ASM_000500 /TAXON_ID=4773 /ORGANISM="Schizochytrium aggregatum, Strain ATCC28209" /LENGTH=39 /DNA_ID= /DNA_START= /DNA_END= /DNA_ORIENTATION=